MSTCQHTATYQGSDGDWHCMTCPATWGPSGVGAGGLRPLTRHTARRLVTTALNAQRDLDDFARNYRGVDMLRHSGSLALQTDRDKAVEAVVAALVGGGS